ncbi:hypothetical protein [Martelella alba]|nr:hypothetical protein [Martelella alba]
MSPRHDPRRADGTGAMAAAADAEKNRFALMQSLAKDQGALIA